MVLLFSSTTLVAMALVWSHDLECCTGGSFGFLQVLPSQAVQRVGSRQIDDQSAGSRERLVLAGSYNLVYSSCELLLLWGEHCHCWLVLRPSTIKSATERSFRRDSTSEWVSDWVVLLFISPFLFIKMEDWTYLYFWWWWFLGPCPALVNYQICFVKYRLIANVNAWLIKSASIYCSTVKLLLGKTPQTGLLSLKGRKNGSRIRNSYSSLRLPVKTLSQ